MKRATTTATWLCLLAALIRASASEINNCGNSEERITTGGRGSRGLVQGIGANPDAKIIESTDSQDEQKANVVGLA